jgi:hypothetical protein
MWADSYEKTWDPIYKEAMSKDNFVEMDGFLAVEKAWREWVDGNCQTIQIVVPLTPVPVVLTASTNPNSFMMMPALMSSKTPPQMAQTIALAWQMYLLSLTWMMVPPAPPFSVITAIMTDPLTITASMTALQANLTSEFAITPQSDVDLKMKYQRLGTYFFTACSTLQVQIIGFAFPPTAPPTPLLIPVPVF